MTDFYPPNDPPNDGREAFWSFDLVEEALVEAMLLWRRSPDRERGWHAVRAYWPEIHRHTFFGDYADTEASPRPLPLTRAQVAERDRVSEWLGFVPEKDRRLVVLAVMQLVNGEKRVPWRKLLAPMGMERGADGLRMRYGRALTAICKRLNGQMRNATARKAAEICGDGVSR